MSGIASRKHIVLLLFICYFLFFLKIGARDLWDPDEPPYAQVAREMIETGDGVAPHLNGEVYPEKPPLYFWLIALAMFISVTRRSAALSILLDSSSLRSFRARGDSIFCLSFRQLGCS